LRPFCFEHDGLVIAAVRAYFFGDPGFAKMYGEIAEIPRVVNKWVSGGSQRGIQIAHHLSFAGSFGIPIAGFMDFALNPHAFLLRPDVVEVIGIVGFVIAAGDDAAWKPANQRRVLAPFGVLRLRCAHRDGERRRKAYREIADPFHAPPITALQDVAYQGRPGYGVIPLLPALSA
jgi:hypothetical protein